MKTFKLSLVIFLFLIFKSTESFSIISGFKVISPRPCENFHSEYFYPGEEINVKFWVASNVVKTGESIFYLIRVEQGSIGVNVAFGNAHAQYNVGTNVQENIDVSGITGLCKNNLAKVKVLVWPFSGIQQPLQNFGYFVIYKESNECGNFAATNGSSAQTHKGNRPYHFLNDGPCKLSTSVYYGEQHKVTFTKYGNFQNTDFEIQKPLCMGYSGANPNNNQHMWGAVEEKSDNHVKFITFVYKLYNVLGQDFMWWPCEPSQAAVVYKEVSTGIPPAILRLVQYPNPLRPNHLNGKIVSYLSQGSPPLSYSWDTIYYGKNGFRGEFTNNSGSNWMSIEYLPSGFSYLFLVQPAETKSIVSNSWGTDNKTVVIPSYSSVNMGCPTLQFDLGDIVVDENTLLVTSPGNPGVDVTDYYFIMNPFIMDENSITFKIHEPEYSYTDLDCVELHQIVTEGSELSAITDDGRVINFNDAYLKAGTDIDVTGNGRSFNASTVLIARNNETVELLNGDVVTITDARLEEGGEFFIYMINKNVIVKADAFAQVQSKDAGMKPLFGRHNENIIATSVSSAKGTHIEIEILQDVEVDQLILVQDLETATVNRLDLLSAKHNIEGDVTDELYSIDQSYVYLSNEQEIEFEFANIMQYDKNLNYAVVTTGQYTDRSQRPAPVSNAGKLPELFGNYPNPFNPVTTISFSIPVKGLVTIKIYDLLGREVAVLADGITDAGVHSVNFDASRLASGIYFYEMKTGNFREVKKMTLLK